MTAPWRVETLTAPAARLLEPPPVHERAVRFLVPEDRAVVLGSTEPESHIDRTRAEEAGVQVLRRRGGGGAVLVGPGIALWADVTIAASDPLWTADVGRAFWWLGDAWAAALSAAGMADTQVWRQGLRRTEWSDRVCFAGLGPGEVTSADRKVVGLSQRRTRAGVHFQCAVPIAWDPSELLSLMALDDAARNQAAADLADVALGVGPDAAVRLRDILTNVLPYSK